MATEKQPACWTIPNLTIDCMLARVHKQLEADGCEQKINDSSSQVAPPYLLAPGDINKDR